MRKMLRKIKQNCKGAVTVFVTLLLIPAVLVSGTGVDIARLYTARSEIRDANQLAANAALASYDALLQDLYGLFGIMTSNTDIGDMMVKYVQLALFGEDWNATGLGNFRLFSGSKVSLGSVRPAARKNLGNVEVLRRQIEEYAKFRAPAVIAEEILGSLDAFDKVQKDAQIIKDKMEIDDKIEEIEKLYKKLYDCIQKVNDGKNVEAGAINSANDYIERIHRTIKDLYTTQTDSYTEAAKDEDTGLADAYLKKYKGLFDNLHNLIAGGKIKDGFMLHNPDGDGSYPHAEFTTDYDTDGLEKSIDKKQDELKGLISNGTIADDSLTELVSLAEKADKKKQELSKMIDDLERKLQTSGCSEELTEGLTVRKDTNGKTQIELYRDLIGVQVTPLAEGMKNVDEPQVNQMIEFLENGVLYRNSSGSLTYSMDHLKSLNENTDGYLIDTIIENTRRYAEDLPLLEDKLGPLHSVSPVIYTVPGGAVPNEYVLFQNVSEENRKFYDMLKNMFEVAKTDVKKKSITDALGKMTDTIQKNFTTILQFEPEGAYRYDGPGFGGEGETGETSSFGQGEDWSKTDTVKESAKNAMGNSFLSSLAQTGLQAVDKLLLLSYDSEMFSCYATNKGPNHSGDGAAAEASMAGVPLGIKVNYYYQSEMEFLYNGNCSDALANLKTVTGLIFLIRFVMNYAVSFTIDDINETVDAVKTALAGLGPAAVVIAELVRLVIVLGESVMDVSRLKNGEEVLLMKNNDTWQFSVKGLITNIGEGIVDELAESALNAPPGISDADQDGLKLSYKDYMRLLLLLVDGDTLTDRTKFLIGLNCQNYKKGIGGNSSREARESEMSAAGLYDLPGAITDFSVTTTVDLRMLFLSEPQAQNGFVEGVIPPKTKRIAVTDYRGY